MNEDFIKEIEKELIIISNTGNINFETLEKKVEKFNMLTEREVDFLINKELKCFSFTDKSEEEAVDWGLVCFPMSDIREIYYYMIENINN